MVVDRDERTRLSKKFFNAEHRLAVSYGLLSAAVALRDMDELVVLCGPVARSCVQKEIAILVEIGAVQRVESGRQVVYQRLDGSSYWAFARELLEQAGATVPRYEETVSD